MKTEVKIIGDNAVAPAIMRVIARNFDVEGKPEVQKASGYRSQGVTAFVPHTVITLTVTGVSAKVEESFNWDNSGYDAAKRRETLRKLMLKMHWSPEAIETAMKEGAGILEVCEAYLEVL